VVREIATGVNHNITRSTNSAGREVDGAAISRDGKQVAYVLHWDDNHYELHVANVADGPVSRRLKGQEDAEIYPHDWSPDGKSIAVEVYLKGQTAHIGLVSVADGSLHLLKAVDRRGPGRISFSPDGKYLGYDLAVNENGGRRDIFVLSVDGAMEIHAPEHRGRDFLMGWSPDGARLVFASEQTGSMSLWSLPFSAGKFQGPAEMVQRSFGTVRAIGMTRNGALYYRSAFNALDGLTVQAGSMDFGTGKFLAAPHDIAPESADPMFAPQWSPDGKYLAYLVQRGSNRLAIRSTVSNGVIRELPVKLTNLVTFIWAPDGRSFVAPGNDGHSNNAIFRIDAETGETSLLASPGPGEGLWFPGLSPDGIVLYYRRALGGGRGYSIVRRDLASGAEKELARGDAVDRVMASPDGEYIAAATVDSAANAKVVKLISTKGGPPREIMRVAAEIPSSQLAAEGAILNGQSLIPAAWVPDSRFLIVRKRLADEKQLDEFWLVPVNGDTPRKLDLRLARDRFMGTNFFSVHPDGRQVAFIQDANGRHSAPGGLWVLENFLPAKSTSK
jgi:Tol biopolymer transport system component